MAAAESTPTAPPAPLAGVRIVDFGGIGPGPFASMVLADLGAEVIRLQRPSELDSANSPVLDRGKKSLVVDLKKPEGVEVVRKLVAGADGCLEGFRPGVAERLGLGPDELLELNPRLVYGRITGYGQTGPRSNMAGHDMNYIASSGVLHQLGRAGEGPQFPANLLGDFGGGGMLLAIGMLAALVRAKSSGEGTVVDAAMVDGANLLWAMMHGFSATGDWQEERGTNMLDSGAPFYDRYETKDGQWVSVGCIEPQFFKIFIDSLGIEDRMPGPFGTFDYRKKDTWPQIRTAFTEAIASRTRDELVEIFDGTDGCVFPILNFDEAEADAHNQARKVFYRDDSGVRQPGLAPRFAARGGASWAGGESDGEPYAQPAPAPQTGAHTAEVLESAGFSPEDVERLASDGVVAGGVPVAGR
ncbi:CaiB/BaiF CoA-transferase family protein [Brevibacterium daeguense]|uniref:CaiB/BaiF CoA-transferase family protein n=1 Tax=Brevibacterium daeguense TaxID=909936 RepID=A0ABP8EJV9_9MICO|nr:CaiB/BaiF CoA-transferase family protein [Brevibacterium daeguense]